MKPLTLGAGQLWVYVPVKEMTVNDICFIMVYDLFYISLTMDA